MDGYELVAKLTESLAWPVVAIVAIYVFRRDARAGLDRLRKFEAFGMSAEFELQRLEREANKIEIQPADPVEEETASVEQEANAERAAPRNSPADDSADATSKTPADIILDAWSGFQNFAVDAYAQVIDEVPQVFFITDIFENMAKKGWLSKDQVAAIVGANQLFNKVKHGEYTPTAELAMRYAVALGTIRGFLEQRLLK